MLARDQAHHDRLDRGVTTSSLDIARSQKRKCELRDRAEAALQPLAGCTADLARNAARARLQARHVVSRAEQRAEAALDEHLARDASVLVCNLANPAGQKPPWQAPTPPAGASQTLAPPVSATGEAHLLQDPGQNLLLVELLREGGQPLS